MALIQENSEKENFFKSKINGFKLFFAKGHAKKYGNGVEFDIDGISNRKQDGHEHDITLAIADIARDKSGGNGGIVAFGVDYGSGKEYVDIPDTAELFSEKTAASQKIEELQKELNEDNNRPNTLILIYDHDEMIRYMANHPMAGPQDYISDALAKLADEKNLGATKEEKIFAKAVKDKTIGKDVINTLESGRMKDAPFSTSEDIPLGKGKVGRISFICPGNVNVDLAKDMDSYLMDLPGAARILKERNISGKVLRRMVINHENGHSNDSQLKSGLKILDSLKNRSDTEKMADVNAAREAFIKGDTEHLDALLYRAYMRVENMADAVFRKAYINAALNGDMPGVLDEDTRKFITEHNLSSQDSSKNAGEAEKMFLDLEQALNKSEEKLNELCDVGMKVAYDNAALLAEFITEMKVDQEFREKITGMNTKEFDQFFPKWRAEHSVDKEAFAKQIIDSSEACFARDESGNYVLKYNENNKDIKKVFEMKAKLEKEFGVTPGEIVRHQRDNVSLANNMLREKLLMIEAKEWDKKYLNGGAIITDMTPKKPTIDDVEFHFFDSFYRKIERESIKNGGSDAEAFDKVWVAEHDRLSLDRNKGNNYLLAKLDELKIKYRDETRKRVSAFKKADMKFKETEMPASDIANLSGDDLAAAYVVNRIAQLDRAEKALSDALDFRFDEAAYDDVMKSEKLSQAYAEKIEGDIEALKTVGSRRKIIRQEISERSLNDNVPGWVANFGAAISDNGNTHDIMALRSRIDEDRQLLAVEVTENAAITAKIKDADPEMAARLEKIAAERRNEMPEDAFLRFLMGALESGLNPDCKEKITEIKGDNKVYNIIPAGFEKEVKAVPYHIGQGSKIKQKVDQIKQAFAARFSKSDR